MPSLSRRTWEKNTDRPLRSWGNALAIWCLARWLGVPVPWSAVHQTDAKTLLAYEHQRLLALAAAGEAVPPVLAFDGHTLVTGDIGPTLDSQLFAMPAEQRLPLMLAASRDLADFHRRGQWHGGAQARNITWDGQRFARLDFEEPLYPALPLSAVQAYDALQLVFSLARLLADLGPDAVQAVWQAYAQGNATVDLKAFLQPLLPRLDRVSRWAGCVARLDRSREIMRLRTVLEGTRRFVNG